MSKGGDMEDYLATQYYYHHEAIAILFIIGIMYTWYLFRNGIKAFPVEFKNLLQGAVAMLALFCMVPFLVLALAIAIPLLMIVLSYDFFIV